MSKEDIDQNKSDLVHLLQGRGRRGGPVEMLEVKQTRRTTAKPFAIATFKSATGEARLSSRLAFVIVCISTRLILKYSILEINPRFMYRCQKYRRVQQRKRVQVY